MSKQNIIIIIVIGIVLFGGMNMLLMMMISQEEKPQEAVQEQKASEQPQPVKMVRVSGELTRRMYMDPNRAFFMNIIFTDGKETARFKSNGEKIFDVEGTIPDGRMKFKNITDGTYGIENFDGGKREGLYKEYFPSGQLRFEKNYFYGKILNLKEFYVSGPLRMETDYSDALWLSDEDEVGDGKIFFKDGILMYEWHLTAQDPNRYKKMYNYRGDLVEIHYFDANGKLVNKQQLPREQEEG